MLTMIKRLVAFRIAQTSARGAARLLGFGRLAAIAVLIGGLRTLKRHRHA